MGVMGARSYSDFHGARQAHFLNFNRRTTSLTIKNIPFRSGFQKPEGGCPPHGCLKLLRYTLYRSQSVFSTKIHSFFLRFMRGFYNHNLFSDVPRVYTELSSGKCFGYLSSKTHKFIYLLCSRVNTV